MKYKVKIIACIEMEVDARDAELAIEKAVKSYKKMTNEEVRSRIRLTDAEATDDMGEMFSEELL